MGPNYWRSSHDICTYLRFPKTRKHCWGNIVAETFLFSRNKKMFPNFFWYILFPQQLSLACANGGINIVREISSTINVSLFAVACPGHGRRRTELFTAAYMTGNFTTSRLQVLLKWKIKYHRYSKIPFTPLRVHLIGKSGFENPIPDFLIECTLRVLYTEIWKELNVNQYFTNKSRKHHMI